MDIIAHLGAIVFIFMSEHNMIVMDSSENKKETKNYVEFVFYRVPKKIMNHYYKFQID